MEEKVVFTLWKGARMVRSLHLQWLTHMLIILVVQHFHVSPGQGDIPYPYRSCQGDVAFTLPPYVVSILLHKMVN